MPWIPQAARALYETRGATMKRIIVATLASAAAVACVALLAGKDDICRFERMRHM